MKKIIAIMAATLFNCLCINAADQKYTEIPLYKTAPAESNGITEAEKIVNNRISNVSNPRILVSLPKEGTATGQAVVVCPGGGYARLAIEHEGYEVAKWLNARGIAAAILIYRMPNGHPEVPLADAQRAIEIVRENAEAWGVDVNNVGIMGFSAGGHLAASALTLYTSELNKPSFGVLVYPVVTLSASTHRGSYERLFGKKQPVDPKLLKRFSCEKNVNAQTPRTFIVLGADDRTVPPVNSLDFAAAMVAAKAPVELHMYPEGVHGFGFGTLRDFRYRSEMEIALSRWLSEKK